MYFSVVMVAGIWNSVVVFFWTCHRSDGGEYWSVSKPAQVAVNRYPDSH